MGARPDDGGSAGASPVGPDLAVLSAGQRRILAYASAIGPEFPFELLRDAMGVEEELLAEELEELVRRGFLTEKPGGGAFCFVQEELRASVYRSMTESRHRLLHRKIAEVLERGRCEPSSSLAAELGRHYFLGKVPSKSYVYNRRAAKLARERDEPSAAIPFLERALFDLPALDGDHRRERAEVAEELGDLSYATGQYRTADRYYALALDHLERDVPQVRARLLLARAEVARENLDDQAATDGAMQALGIFEEVRDRVGASQSYRLLGRVAFQEGRYRDALEHGMRALDALPADADGRVLGRLSIEIGNAFALLGEEVRPIAIEWYERAVDRLRTSRDWVELARALHNLGTIVGESRPLEGLELLDRAREVAERGHDSRGAGRCLLSGVELRLAVGQLEEAERDNVQAGRILGRLADHLGLDLAAKNAGRIAERRGQWDDAAAAYARAIDIAQRYHLTAEEAEGQYCLAHLKFKTREFEEARTALSRALELGVAELSPRLAPAIAFLERQLGLTAATEASRRSPPDLPVGRERPLA